MRNATTAPERFKGNKWCTWMQKLPQKIYTSCGHVSQGDEMDILCNLCFKTENSVEDKINFKINQEKEEKRKFHCSFGNYYVSFYSWLQQWTRWFVQYIGSCNKCDRVWFLNLVIGLNSVIQKLFNWSNLHVWKHSFTFQEWENCGNFFFSTFWKDMM